VKEVEDREREIEKGGECRPQEFEEEERGVYETIG
jgi:hypothetical protein